ncbi:hypothetical protein DL98DRAFT_535647 [Cadophora sp. DSE1049]|nr:hypothetical protein DL98DRAFT_535647 [Cadophora sp. DSE1049]
MIQSSNQSAPSVAPQQFAMVNTAATTFTKITKRMLEEIPPTTTKPILNTDPPVRISSIELHGFKRIMTSPIVVNTTSEISGHTIFIRAEISQNNATNLNGTADSTQDDIASGNNSPWVIFGYIAIVVVAVAMLVSTISVCLKARKKAVSAKREREEEEAEEARKIRLAGLSHLRVELKDLGEIIRPERAV